MISLEHIEQRLHRHKPKAITRFSARRRAAVAAVLRACDDTVEVLLMERAHRTDDRWSGQVSLPGGREHIDDPDLLATAIRETHEEVGLELGHHGRLLGQLDAIRAVARGELLPMSITPYVFHLTEPAQLQLGPEAANAFWLPLGQVVEGALDSEYQHKLGPAQLRLPCWRFQGYVVWGLTYQMLAGLVSLISGQ